MKSNIIYTGLCSLALLATACSEIEPVYEPAAPCATPAVYFTPATSTSFKVGETDTEFTVTAYRTDDSQAATYPLTLVSATDASLFHVPATVSFAAGETTTTFDVTYTATSLEGMKPYTITIAVGDGKDTPYVNQNLTYTVVYQPWNDVVGPNGEEYALYTDDFVSTWFNVGNQTYEVKLQSSPAIKGLYRLVNPYGEPYPYNEPGDYDTSENHYMYFNCADPNVVFLCNAEGQANVGNSMAVFNTGMDWGYGEFIFTGVYNLRMAQGNSAAAIENAGTYSKGVVTFPAKTLLARMDEYTAAGSWSYANNNGAFKIVFPGVVEEADPLDTWETVGDADYTDGLVLPIYGMDPITYKVPVEQYQKDPNLYRLVNPYKAGIMPDYGIDYEDDRYIVFNATNPDCVLIPDFYETGWMDSDDGELYVINQGGYYVSYTGKYSEEVIIANKLNDTFADGIFTFPTKHMLWGFFDSPDDETSQSIYSSVAEVKVVLPSATAPVATTTASAESVAAKYLGTRVNHDAFDKCDRVVSTFRGTLEKR